MSATDDDITASNRRGFLKRTAAAAGAAATVGTLPSAAAAQEGPSYDGWLDNTSNFNGTYDLTGRDQVTVIVGAEGNEGNYAFSPAAMRIDPGTEVLFEWTGEGGVHNVVDNAGNFESELYSEAGQHFSQTFDSEGTFKYLCVPHEPMGMKGAIAVGGSGGMDPSELEQFGEGGGSSGESGNSGSPFRAAALVSSLVLGLLSPIVFGIFMFFDDSEDT